MEKEMGWNPLPKVLKFIFVVEVIGLLISLFSFKKLEFLFGIPLPNILGYILYYLIVFGGTIVLLVAFWKRYEWTWKYCLWW